MKRIQNVLIIMLITGLISVACQPSSVNNGDFEETAYRLKFIRKSIPLQGKEITIRFEDDKVSGNAGCNSYFGTIKIKGNGITFSQLAMTEMACMEPEGIMEQEQEYLSFLSDVVSFSIDGDQLILKKDGQAQLTFEIIVD